MAKVPETTQDNPYSASPDDIDVDVESQFSAEEMQQIATDLAPMDTEALNSYFQQQGIEGEDADIVRGLIDQIKLKQQSQAAAPSVSAQSAQMPASTPGPVGPGLEQPQLPPGLTPERYLEAIKEARADSPLLGLASDMILGESAMLPFQIPSIVSAFLPISRAGTIARYGIAGASGLAAALMGEDSENAVREKLGLEKTEYNWFQNALNAVGVGSVVKGAKSLPAAFSKEAAEGALGIQKSVNALAEKLADARGLTDAEKTNFVEEVNKTMRSKLEYYDEYKGFSPEMRAQKAFQDTAQELRITESLDKAISLVPDLPPEVFAQMAAKEMAPGRQLFEAYQGKSMARQRAASEQLGEEVNKTIELARKGKASADGLFVPLDEFREGINKIFQESQALMPKLKDGSEVFFQNGDFFLRTKAGNVKRIADSDGTYQSVLDGINQSEYLKTIFNMWQKVDSRFKTVVSGGKDVATALPKANITLEQLTMLRSELDKSLADGASKTVEAAKNKVVGMLRGMEDTQIDRLASNSNPALAQAAQNYKLAKQLSFASAEVFDDLVKTVGFESHTIANAFNKLSIDQVKKFVSSSKVGIPSLKGFKSPIVGENIVRYVGRRMMENRFDDLVRMAAKGKGLDLSDFKKFPELVRNIGADMDFRLKMEAMLGKKEFNAALKSMENSLGDAEKIIYRLQAAEKIGNVKAVDALKASAAEIATRAATTASGASNVYTLPFFKRIFDSIGLKQAQDAVNRVVFTKGLDDFVMSLRSTEDGVLARRQIIQAFGDNPLGAKVLADFDNKARILFMGRKELATAAGAKIASQGSRAFQELPAREQPGQY